MPPFEFRTSEALVQHSPLEPLRGTKLLSWRQHLLNHGGNAADFDWLLDIIGGLSWSDLQYLRLFPERPVALKVSLEQLEDLWLRSLRTQEPLQYLARVCPWRDLTLSVAPGVLIPRQETELLVDLADSLSRHCAPKIWADLGSGSGCLAIALAHLWPSSRGFAVDVSPEALRQTASNLETSGVQDQLRLLEGSWWSPLEPWWGQLHLVVANPPYIPTDDWARLEPRVRNHEPPLALDGGPDGLRCLRTIIAGASMALAPGGQLLLEHHHDQSEAVQALLRNAGLEEVISHSDLEGTLRFASACRPVGNAHNGNSL
jgi:release factor glutamine methyltransferase